METIKLSGINGIRNNVSVEFQNTIEEIIERVVASPELKDVSSETIAELIDYAILDFSIEMRQIRYYIEATRKQVEK